MALSLRGHRWVPGSGNVKCGGPHYLPSVRTVSLPLSPRHPESTRLKLPHVILLQIHNSITRNRHDQPTSITVDDVLGPMGLLAGMEEVRAAGWVDHFGLTGIGDAESLKAVMQSGSFATIQAPFH